jgi:antitoxin component YwqK of YwqJK toxin-antitoxin module
MLQKKAVIVFLLFVLCGYCFGCGSKHKTKEEHSPDGKLKAIYSYNDEGILDGVTKRYYPSGKLKGEETYKNNAKEGIYKEYYESGKLRRETNYKDGKLDGIVKEYYENGKVMVEGISKNDALEGIYKEYYESGKLRRETNYKEGTTISKTCYDEQGNIIKCPY